MAKSMLFGLPTATRKKIREQIKVEKKLVKQQEEQEYEKYWTSLNSLKKQIDGLIDKAKVSGSVPKGTTLKRLTMMPKAKPTRWSSVFKRIFGRKSKKVATKNKNPKTKTKAKRKRTKTKAKAKSAVPRSAGAMATTTKQQRYESKRQNNKELTDMKNEARRLRRANGSTN